MLCNQSDNFFKTFDGYFLNFVYLTQPEIIWCIKMLGKNIVQSICTRFNRLMKQRAFEMFWIFRPIFLTVYSLIFIVLILLNEIPKILKHLRITQFLSHVVVFLQIFESRSFSVFNETLFYKCAKFSERCFGHFPDMRWNVL